MLMIAVAGCATPTPTAAPTAAPTPAPTSKTITDQTGATVTVPYPATSIAVPVIVNEWVLVMLGVEDRQVAGANNVATSPALLAYYPGFAKMPAPFTGWSASGVNIETLLAAKPGVIVMDPSDPRVSQVAGTGIPVVQASYSTDMKGYMSIMGSLFGGNPEKIANEYVSWYDSIVANISAKISDIPTDQRAKYVRIGYWNGQWSATTPDMTYAYTLAGGVNVVPANNSLSVTEEQAIAYAKQANVIFTPNNDVVKAIKNDSAWNDVPAIKNGKLYFELNGIGAYSSAIPEAQLGMVWAANILYPDRFSGTMNLTSQMEYFYPKFYHYDINATEISMTLSGQGFVPDSSRIIR